MQTRRLSPLAILFAALCLTLHSNPAHAQRRDSLAGEQAAQEIKSSLTNEQYNLRYGPLRYRTEARLGLGYTDNVFLSEDREHDWLVNPEFTLSALLPVSDLNSLRLALGIGYEWYANHSELNSDAPLINPDSELVFHIFAGDFHIRLRDTFSYQESLFFNSRLADGRERFFNFTDVGRFRRLNNVAGIHVDWDLNELILSAGYDFEYFNAMTERFDYLDRMSHLLTGSAAFLIGDSMKAGIEGQASWNDYESETVLNDHWRARGGPFLEINFRQGISLRIGGGYDTAQYDAPARSSDYDTYYAYGRIRQKTRLFTHSLTAGREHLLGDNANNLKTIYARYAIVAPIVRDVDLGAHVAAHFDEEFGGGFREDFDYYIAGLRVGYQFHKHWRTDLGYEFRLKDSDLALRDYHRNRVTWSLAFLF